MTRRDISVLDQDGRRRERLVCLAIVKVSARIFPPRQAGADRLCSLRLADESGRLAAILEGRCDEPRSSPGQPADRFNRRNLDSAHAASAEFRGSDIFDRDRHYWSCPPFPIATFLKDGGTLERRGRIRASAFCDKRKYTSFNEFRSELEHRPAMAYSPDCTQGRARRPPSTEGAISSEA